MIQKYILFGLLITTTNFFAQKVIADVKFTKEKSPLQTIYLPNVDKLVVQSGTRTNKVYGNIIKDISSYDTDGFVEKMITNEELVNCVFSPIENAFLIAKLPKSNTYPDEYKLVLDGSPSKYFKLLTGFRYFNDIYGFNILNQNKEYKIDLQKDDLNLYVVDIFSNVSQKYQLEKPDLFRLENKITAEYKEGLNFDVRINESNIGIITKSINKNFKSSTLYRTVYNLVGERIGDIPYNVSVPKNYLIFSNNGGGIISQNEDEVKISDLAINNFIVDKTTEDLYVYGLFGAEGKTSNYNKNIPLGFYVFKFDKNGKLIWDSIQDVVDVLGFNQPQELNTISLAVKLRNDDIIVSVNSLSNQGYLDFVTLNINSGEKISTGKSDLSKGVKNNDDNFVKSDFEIKDLLNKNIDKETVIATQINTSVFDYLKSVRNDKRLFYKTFISKKGIWLLETDNESFYKILFFKN